MNMSALTGIHREKTFSGAPANRCLAELLAPLDRLASSNPRLLSSNPPGRAVPQAADCEAAIRVCDPLRRGSFEDSAGRKRALR